MNFISTASGSHNVVYSKIISTIYKKKFYVKGHEVEFTIDSNQSETYLIIIFSMISLHGIKAYNEIKMNGFDFGKEVEDKLMSIFRDDIITDVMNNKET